MTTAETLVAAVRRAREREKAAELDALETRDRLYTCRVETETAEANLKAFTRPASAFSFEDDFNAMIDRAMAVVADQARARATASAG